MAKLHCCLAGFDAEEALTIESLAGMVQLQLTVGWSFSTAPAEACDLLLCDLDSTDGATAWRNRGLRSEVRAAVTGGTAVFGGLMVRKPLRTHGPDGLVHLLNEAAARIGTPSADPSLAAPGPAAHRLAETDEAEAAGPAPHVPARPGRLRSLFRAIMGWFGGSAARAPSRQPVEPSLTRPAPPPPEPTRHQPGPPPLHTHARPHAVEPALAAPALASGGELAVLPSRRLVSQAVPGMRRGTMVLDGMGCDLLGLLRRAKAASQVIVFRLDGIPAICAAPTNETCYTLATLKSVFDVPDEALVPAYVTVAQNSYYGRMEVQAGASRHPVSIPGVPLKNLLWVATLRCGGADEIAAYRDGTFAFAGWPDLANLPHKRHHFTWCGLLSHRAMTAAALAKATGHDADEAAIFLAACGELGILNRKGLPASLALPMPAGHGPDRAGPPRAALGRLGLARS